MFSLKKIWLMRLVQIHPLYLDRLGNYICRIGKKETKCLLAKYTNIHSQMSPQNFHGELRFAFTTNICSFPTTRWSEAQTFTGLDLYVYHQYLPKKKPIISVDFFHLLRSSVGANMLHFTLVIQQINEWLSFLLICTHTTGRHIGVKRKDFI